MAIIKVQVHTRFIKIFFNNRDIKTCVDVFMFFYKLRTGRAYTQLPINYLDNHYVRSELLKHIWRVFEELTTHMNNVVKW